MSGANLMPMHGLCDGAPLDPCDCTGWTEEDLPLTGLWRANYGGAPFVGTASAGTSGSNNLTTADPVYTNRAWTAGPVVNGYTSAHSDGEMQLFVDPLQAMQMTADGAFSDYAADYAFSGWALVKCTTLGAPVDHNGGVIFRAFNRTLGNDILEIQVVSGGTLFSVEGLTDPVPVSTSARDAGITFLDTWVLVTFRYDGATIQMGVNEKPGVGTAVAYTSPLDRSTADPLQLGMQELVFHFQDRAFAGDILNAGVTNTVMTDEEFCKLVCRMRARYDLPLVGPS